MPVAVVMTVVAMPTVTVAAVVVVISTVVVAVMTVVVVVVAPAGKDDGQRKRNEGAESPGDSHDKLLKTGLWVADDRFPTGPRWMIVTPCKTGSGGVG